MLKCFSCCSKLKKIASFCRRQVQHRHATPRSIHRRHFNAARLAPSSTTPCLPHSPDRPASTAMKTKGARAGQEQRSAAGRAQQTKKHKKELNERATISHHKQKTLLLPSPSWKKRVSNSPQCVVGIGGGRVVDKQQPPR